MMEPEYFKKNAMSPSNVGQSLQHTTWDTEF